MRPECRSFRALLERKLAGPAAHASNGPAQAQSGAGPFGTLAWHEHLLGCGACRELLAAEEALEILLATLPEPRLPQELARRVLTRLRAAIDLDALLELDLGARAPERLAARILDSLQRERARAPQRERAPESVAADPVAAATEARLDVLLERDRAIESPAGLARRVLVALRGARRVAEPVPLAALVREPARAIRQRSFALAALLLALLGAACLGATWLWSETRNPSQRELREARERSAAGSARETTPPDETPFDAQSTSDELAQFDAGVHAAPDAQMLAALDVLEQWDLLMQEDVDVLLSTIDQAEQILLEYQSEAPAPAQDPKAEPSQG